MKYKIGDLVTLSAAGKKSNLNPAFFKSGFGVIVYIASFRRYPYKIKWFNEGRIEDQSCKAYELKRFKPTKSKKNKKSS